MRIAFYTIPPVRLEKPSKRVEEYYKSELEKLYSDALRAGVIDEELFDMYSTAVRSLESGKLSTFRRIFQELRVKVEERKAKRVSFEYVPPCLDCAIVSVGEGELALRIMKRGLVNGHREEYFERVFFVYDLRGSLRAVGGIVPVEVLRRAAQEIFIAVA